MGFQGIDAIKRGGLFPRFTYALVLALSFLASASVDTANASPGFEKPTQDVVDLCTWSSANRASIAQSFSDRGWTKFRAPYPEAIPLLLADGALFHALLDERYNSFGLDTETGVIPDMQDNLKTIAEVSQRGTYDAYWWDGDTKAFVMIHDARGNRNLGEDVRCRLLSSSLQDARLIADAIHQYQDDRNEVQIGPARTVNLSTIGAEPHRQLSGIAAVLVKMGLLVDRPVAEPQLRMGPARLDFFRYEVSEFERQFSRTPHAAFALEIVRRNEEAKP